ncbi:MAG TPA: hypothetical protein VHE53_00440 [Patescibacteria group bacterium]|nr:hypothetical protein [Patescibacteria group bacterium]
MNNTKTLLVLVVAALVIGLGWVFLYKYQNKNGIDPTKSTSSAILNPVFYDVKVWLPGVSWSTPKKTSEQTMYGDLKGEESTAQITTKTATVSQFENVKELNSMGYHQDINLEAGGPGSSIWGYKKTDGKMSQIVTFSYNTTPSSNNPNEPLQFNCPCKTTLKVFVSDPFNEKQ